MHEEKQLLKEECRVDSIRDVEDDNAEKPECSEAQDGKQISVFIAT